MILTPTTPFSQRAVPSPLWSRTSTKRRIRRGTTRISRFRCGKAERGCASRVPPVARRNGAPNGRGEGGESDPYLLAASAARGRAKGDRGRDTPCPPCRGRSHHRDPCGKADEPTRKSVPPCLSSGVSLMVTAGRATSTAMQLRHRPSECLQDALGRGSVQVSSTPPGVAYT